MSFARKPSAVGNDRHHPHTLSTLVSFIKRVIKNKIKINLLTRLHD